MVAKGRISLFGYVWKFGEVTWASKSQPCVMRASLAAMGGFKPLQNYSFSTIIDKKSYQDTFLFHSGRTTAPVSSIAPICARNANSHECF
jgi:hypothetical protein